ncbi:MAG TPA: serine hydrolase [Chryseosolibacter sp.]|nr:serine hydrolase [Chryseosolibacter sp.]
MKKLFSLFLVLIFLSPVAAQVDLNKLDAYYAKALKDWNVPGMSIGIVKDGKLIFAKGYGVKEAGKNDKPDENTLYAIASNSKAFTSAAIGQLVDEGKMSWDDNVRKYIPYFELYDPWVSDHITVRDLLCHRAGLAEFGGDIVWYRSNLNAEQIIRRIKHLPPAYDFRAGYGYSNVMYITAGEVIKQVTGKPWGQVISESFFTPLDMSRTITTTRDLDKKGNYAMPHRFADEKHSPIQWEDWSGVEATAGIISSVKDMSQWMIFNLNHGIWNKDTLLSASSRNTVWTPHNNFVVNHTDKDNSIHLRGYGLGWGVNDYYGKLRVGHTGGYSGMLSGVAMIPEENLGVVILTNGMKGIFGPLINYTLEAFLKVPQKDWSASELARRNAIKDTRIAERKAARVTGTKTSLPVEKYTGEYFTDVYGKITVADNGGLLRINFEHTPDLSATLHHWHYNVFEIKWDKADQLPWFTFGTVKFVLDNNTNVKGIEFDVPNDDFWFEELNARKVK